MLATLLMRMAYKLLLYIFFLKVSLVWSVISLYTVTTCITIKFTLINIKPSEVKILMPLFIFSFRLNLIDIVHGHLSAVQTNTAARIIVNDRVL